MELNEAISQSYGLKCRIDALKAQRDAIDAEIKGLEASKQERDSAIVEGMKAIGATEVAEGDCFANLMRRESLSYDDPDAVIGYLEANGRPELVRVRKELNKVAINKAIKTDGELAKGLAGMASKKVTEYVVLTDAEGHAKMLEHLGKGPSEKA